MQEVRKALNEFETDFKRKHAENLRLQSQLADEKTQFDAAHNDFLEKEERTKTCLQKIHDLVCNDHRFKTGLHDSTTAMEREVLEFMRRLMDMMYQFLGALKEQLTVLEDRVKKWTQQAKKRIRIFAECFGYAPREFLSFALRIFERMQKRHVMISNLVRDYASTL